MSAVPAAPVLALSGLSKRFGALDIIRGVDLTVTRGERLGIIGPNGAGKSTLFNLISGRFAPSGGDILLNGQRIAGRAPHDICRRGLARSFQISNLFGRLSVFENLRVATLWSLGYGHTFWRLLDGLPDARDRAAQLLDNIGLAARRDTLAGELSYAEQRALEIGITLAGNPEVILLDEPTSGMSRSEARATTALIARLTAGKTLLIIEHDMDVVFGLADRIAVLVQGELIACAAPADVRADVRVQHAYLGRADAQAR